MNIICIDDEPLIVQRTIQLLKTFPQVSSAVGFLNGVEALEYMEGHPVDVVFTDISMPEMDGMMIAGVIRDKWPNTIIIFLTAYDQFAINAFKVRANGYLLKPIGKAQLEEELRNAAFLLNKKTERRIIVRTFGNFEVFVDGEVVSFARKRSKEILAYLICKNGTSVSRSELAGILWEDAPYDRSKQKQLDVYVRSMMMSLRDYHVDDIVEMKSGHIRICPEKIDCDYYRYCKGEPGAKKLYTGEFMNAYSWAEYMNASFR